MAIAFKASYLAGSTNTSTTASASLILADESNAAYSLQQDDFCLMFWAASDDNSRVTAFQNRFNLDGTWQKVVNEGYTLDSGSPDNNITTGVYYKKQGATPDTTMPIPNVSGTNMAVAYGMLVFSGVDAVAVIDAVANLTGTNTGRPNPPAILPIAAGAWPVVFCAASNGSTTGAAFIQGGDLSATTNNFRTTNSNGSSKDCTAGFGLKKNWVSGTFDPIAWTGSTTDADSCWSSHVFSLVPAKPVISPTITNQNQVENVAFSQTYTADMAVTWSIVGGTDSGKFSIGSGTGTLTMSAKDYEAPDDANADRVYGVTIRADAGGGSFTDKPVTVTITNANAPTITPATFVHTVAHNTAFSFDYAPNTATWSIIGGADAAKFAITTPAGVLSMTAKDFFNPTDVGANNVYEVTIRAASVEGNTDQAITVTVQRPLLFPTAAVQDTSGTATGSWINLNLLYADDETEAWHGNIGIGLLTDIATISGFDMSSVPDGSTILGIEVIAEVDGSTGSGTITSQMEFAVKGSAYKVTGYVFGRDLTETVVTLGGPTDTWGLSGADLTGVGLKSGFDVKMLGRGFTSGTGQARLDVDYVAVRIYFNPSVTLTSTNVTTAAAQVTQATLGQVHNLGWPELVINGNFNSNDTTGWGVANGGVLSVVGGRLRLTTGIAATAYTDYNASVTAGVKYVFRISAYDATGQCWWWLGQEGGDIPYNFNDPGDYVGTIVPNTGNLTFRLHEATVVVGAYAEYDNISISRVTELATSAPVLTSVTLGQKHNLVDLDLATPVLLIAFSTIGQKHNITASTLATPGVSITQAAIGQKHNLSAGVLALPVPVISQSATTSFAALVTTNLTTPVPAITLAVFGQKHILTVGLITVSTGPASITNASLAVIRVLTSTNLATPAPSITNATLLTVRVLTSTNVATPAALISNATIGQTHNIVDVDIVTSAPAIGSATIGQTHILATQNVATFQPAITQVAALGIVNFIAQNVATPAALISNAAITVIPTVVKIIRPESTVATGGWTDELDGMNLAESLDEAVANDADYAKSSPDPVNDICRIRLQSLQATAIYPPAKLRYRLKRTGEGPGPDQTVRLYSGGNGTIGSGTLVGSWTHDVTVLTTFEQTVNQALIDPAQPLFVELEAA